VAPDVFVRVVLWSLRSVFLLAAGVLVWLAPVTVYRCEPADAGAARCRIESTRAGIAPLDAEEVTGIASADNVPDRLTLRLLDASGEVLHARTGSAMVGASMPSVAAYVSAVAAGRGEGRRPPWQWPLPVAFFAGAALVFVASGLWPVVRGIGRLFGRRAPDRQVAGPARPGLLEWGLALGFVAGALGILRVAPVVSYACVGVAGGGGAACVVEWRWGGVALVDRAEVGAIARADASEWTVTRTERDGGSRTRTSSEAKSRVTFYDARDRVLFSDEQSGAIGTGAEALADRVNGLAAGDRQDPFLVWQAPWLPLLFGSILLLLGFPMLVERLRHVALGPGVAGRLTTLALAGIATALVVGWLLLLTGSAPPPVATLLGIPTG
jgi:hypothetical protein